MRNTWMDGNCPACGKGFRMFPDDLLPFTCFGCKEDYCEICYYRGHHEQHGKQPFAGR